MRPLRVGGYIRIRAYQPVLETMVDTNDMGIRSRTGIEGKEDFKGEGLEQQQYSRGGGEGSPYQEVSARMRSDARSVPTVTPALDMVFPPPRILFVIKPVSTRLSVSISGRLLGFSVCVDHRRFIH